MVSVEPNEAQGALETVETLLGDGTYRGIFSAEFKRDERDGLFKILEVNTRSWWYVEFAASCGVNVVEMAYRDALGVPVGEVSDYAVGRRFVHSYHDISACVREKGGRTKGLICFLTSLRGSSWPILRWDDPLPALQEFADLAKRALARRIRAILGR